MSDILLSNETLIRLAAFAGIVAAMATWEILEPRRDQTLGRGTRWPGNIGIVALDAVLVRLVFPTTAEQQFRLQSALLGSNVRHLSRSAGGGP